MWRGRRRAFSTLSSVSKWDAVVVGGGHNGLTAAAYLARSGLSVAVLERRHVIGGAAVTEELVPGFRFSRCSYLQSLLRPSIIKYEKQLQTFCNFMDSLLDSPTPEIRHDVESLTDRLKDKLQKSVFWSHRLQQALSLGQKDIVDFMELLVSPASKVLNNWFEGDVLKATLATDAVIGSTASVHTPGSGYVLLHHVMGETGGDRGGMGSVSLAISNAAREAGAHIITNAEVAQLMVDDKGAVNGVMLADGTQVQSSVVLSNATPYRTFMELLPQNALPEDFLCAIKNLDYSSKGPTKINIAVDNCPSPARANTLVIVPRPSPVRMEEIDLACRDAWNGLPSKQPLIEMTIPSVLDTTISPPGKHVINLFVQYTPYKLLEGSWEDPTLREAFAQRCFSLIDEYASGFSSSIIEYDMLTPPDLEKEFGLTGGNIFHGAMGLDSLFLMRPVKGWSDYRTPLQGLYLCGSGTHPGGGVMGAPGRNAAHVVLQDMKKLTAS
ncbi:pyridine nucleotide-disulfide oxidoreductase domain-containing protein 2 [Cinnamomum micranthum f. kanehirae]|uniref:Pyridine nucleotide-disulfide oxidoreductase domain-containing protein 2 n=1 Tax=Cinnamomum micranthum f. kanehirae TaxID=337451 RepID=A0A3S4PWH8_9MAGN|nr:pyridine nucleotide-disulfide oxidoreductase domain-containing protein 2 [Cinnamomum micranthum f. kanehirae]